MDLKAQKQNSSKQQQHYVPRVLLSQFAGNTKGNRVFVYDKHASRSFGPITVDKICKEGGFYVAESINGKVSIEEAFHPLEDAYGKLAPKIIEARTLAYLSAAEFVDLATFVCVQFLRVPRIRIAFEQISQLIIDKAKAIAPDAPNTGELEMLVDENALRVGHLEAIAHGAAKHAKEIVHYAWFLMETDIDQNLWTSDCPVVLHNDEKGFYSGLGLAAPGVQLYMPVTPNLLLVCWHPVTAGRFIKKQIEDRHLLGRMKIQSIVGLNPDRTRLLPTISQIEASLVPIDAVVSAIKNRGSVKASKDNVLFYNWLQFQWSHRFVLCAKGQFSEAIKMLKRHPELRSGMRMGDASGG